MTDLWTLADMSATTPIEIERPLKPCCLYRFFGEGGRLLYVGISENLPTRLSQHRADKPWWHEVRSISVEHFPTRLDAEVAEREAIEREEPTYNRQWSRGRMVMRTIRIHEATWEAAKAKAEAQGESISDVIRRLIAEWVEDEK